MAGTTGHGRIDNNRNEIILADGVPVVTAASAAAPIGGEIRKLLSPPIGGKKRGRPRSQLTMADRALAMNVSVRGIERASFVRRRGIREIGAMCEAGQLLLTTAEWIARWPADFQRELIQGRPPGLRHFVRIVRMGIEQEDRAGNIEEPERSYLLSIGILKARA